MHFQPAPLTRLSANVIAGPAGRLICNTAAEQVFDAVHEFAMSHAVEILAFGRESSEFRACQNSTGNRNMPWCDVSLRSKVD